MSTEGIVIHTMQDDLVAIRPPALLARRRWAASNSKKQGAGQAKVRKDQKKAVAAYVSPPADFKPQVSAPKAKLKINDTTWLWLVGISLFALLLAIVVAIMF